MGPCVAHCLCSRVGSVAVAVPAPTICFAPLSIVTADAVRIQCELVNIAQKSGESVLSYVDRVESLWQELEGTSLTVPEVYAVDHMRRGMSPDHGALFSLFTSTAAESFETVRRIILSNMDARVSRNASGGGDAAALRSQLQQLQLQHAQLQQRVDGGGPNRPPQGGNHFSQGGNRSNSSNRTTWYCSCLLYTSPSPRD